MKDKLVEYAESQLKRKIKPAEIKKKLIAVGHDPEHAEHAVEHARMKKWHHMTIYVFTIFIIFGGFLVVRSMDFSFVKAEESVENNVGAAKEPVIVIKPRPVENVDHVTSVIREMTKQQDLAVCDKLHESRNKQFCADSYYFNKALQEKSKAWCTHIYDQTIRASCMRESG